MYVQTANRIRNWKIDIGDTSEKSSFSHTEKQNWAFKNGITPQTRTFKAALYDHNRIPTLLFILYASRRGMVYVKEMKQYIIFSSSPIICFF